MASAKFRSVGGSIMVAVPRHMVEQLKLAPNADVELTIEGNQLVMEPKRRSGRMGLAARLARCDASVPMSVAECEWLQSPRAGREEL